MSPYELEHLMKSGQAVAPEALAGWTYRGTGLAMPRLVARVFLKFAKVFHQDPGSRVVRGWNIRIRQDGLDAPWTPATVAGHRIVFGHFQLVEGPTRPPCHAYPSALLLDYARGERPWSPLAIIRDHVVALSPDDPSVLLGRMHFALMGRCVPTPSYFLLERHLPLDRVEIPPTGLPR
ncbi:MAG: hypothetical protein EP329_21755 [Deltaproteobacteria bacterium]|nr:MAG: hypothetical protein EP329_21755 [Deltaproteobacteria bacterium]